MIPTKSKSTTPPGKISEVLLKHAYNNSFIKYDESKKCAQAKLMTHHIESSHKLLADLYDLDETLQHSRKTLHSALSKVCVTKQKAWALDKKFQISWVDCMTQRLKNMLFHVKQGESKDRSGKRKTAWVQKLPWMRSLLHWLYA